MFDIEFLDIAPLKQADGTVRLPGSKSISNRVLLLAALSQGETTVHDLLASDDTAVMLTALRQLGCTVTQNGSAATISGLGGKTASHEQQNLLALFMGNAGTAMRPLTAALAVLGGNYSLSGVPRMHERPIGDLVDALRQLGCRIDYLGQTGFPPLRIHPHGDTGLQLQKSIQVRGDVSSQFLTALLLALPLAARDFAIQIEVIGTLISKPYIEITLNLLRRFGICVEQPENEDERWQRFTIPAGSRYQSPGVIHVEADASSASYFIALGAIAACAKPVFNAKNLDAGWIEILGVGSDSIQGDIRFVDAARRMGAVIETAPNSLRIQRGNLQANGARLKAIDIDCNAIPDAAMTLAVMALYADGTTVLRNIASWRVKETDRIEAMACELRKLGATVESGADYLAIIPPARIADWRPASIHTYDDHRIAMCFSLAAFNPAHLPVRILDPKCVAKTFPDYFETLFSVVKADARDIPIICIDGPTASGKGTLAARVARELGFHYLDSGVLYRLTALAADRAGLNPDVAEDVPAIATIARDLPVQFGDDGCIYLDGEDVSEVIRSESVGMGASGVAVWPAVREALLALQRRMQRLPGLVADGRDMGTVVFPNAMLKVHLTASADQRAQRRHKQLISKGESITIIATANALKARDLQDSTRSSAPLKPSLDARLLDNSDLPIDECARQVLDWWQGIRPF